MSGLGHMAAQGIDALRALFDQQIPRRPSRMWRGQAARRYDRLGWTPDVRGSFLRRLFSQARQ